MYLNSYSSHLQTPTRQRRSNNGVGSRRKWRDKTREGNIRGLLLLVLISAVVITLVWYWITEKVQSGELSAVETINTVVLFDASDKYSPTQLSEAKQILNKHIKLLPSNGKLVAFALDPSKESYINPLFSVKNPRDCTKVAWYKDRGYCMKTQKTEQTQEKFKNKVDYILNHLGENLRVSNTSPILEALHHISQLSNFAKAGQKRKFVYIGDALQHNRHSGTKISHFQNYSLSMLDGSIYAPDDNFWDGVQVLIYQIYRDKKEQRTKKFKKFWRSYFENADYTAKTL